MVTYFLFEQVIHCDEVTTLFVDFDTGATGFIDLFRSQGVHSAIECHQIGPSSKCFLKRKSSGTYPAEEGAMTVIQNDRNGSDDNADQVSPR
jgi:hypothetical protein